MKTLQVIVVDDEPAIRQVLAAYLSRAGHQVDQAENGVEGLERLSRGDYDVCICDMNMPEMGGIELVKRATAQGLDTTFVMITAYASVDSAIEAMKAGAHDYVLKPLRHEELLHRLEHIANLRGLKDENTALRRLVTGDGEEVYACESPAVKQLDRMVSKVAPTDSTVLVTGESGTGKGVVARLLHRASQRARQAFIPVNCGAIPENLIESEFFGHARGAFTGADKATKGLFQQADRGTIFLDEIGELPLALQAKLLHVIEDKQFRPLGSEQVRKVDVRIIAATNRNLADMVAEGTFREDLYFRLGSFHLHVPPLRERKDDIPGLVRFLLAKGARRHLNGRPPSLDPEVEEILVNYDWPGNVRQLENVVERALILAEDGRVTAMDLPAEVTRVTDVARERLLPPGGGGTLRDQTRRFEADVIQATLAELNGDRRAAAQKLGIGLSSLYRKIEEYQDLMNPRAEAQTSQN